ncbi:MAG: hypothetical protein A2076_12510 [Geobacteraceae bacterium GWC2_53_11]|nr:MAG: hypothetical protein A2076_12510 [Geobacteraceae bacterium GWC2_53_11]
MDDQQLWSFGTARLAAMRETLSGKAAELLSRQFKLYRQIKEEHAAIVADIDAASVCRDCKGQCCLNGKYRINSLDYLARLAEGIPTVADFTCKPLCPYGSENGCTMEPGLRPSDCVLFVCDEIDRKLSPQARTSLAGLEQNLRECIQDSSHLIGEEVGVPLLLWAERNSLS